MKQQSDAAQAVLPYRKQLIRSAILQSLIAGVTAALAGCAIALAVCKYLHQPQAWIIALIALLSFISAAWIVWQRKKPGLRQTARELDALGLQERTATMLALQADDSPMARLQREETLYRLEQVQPEQINSHTDRRLIVSLVVAMLLLCGGILLPESWFPAPVVQEPTTLESIIAALQEEQAQLMAQNETALADELGELIDTLSETDSELEAVSAIQATAQSVAEAAEAGEATEEAAAEAEEALESALEQLTGEAPEESSEEPTEPAEGEPTEESGEPGEPPEEPPEPPPEGGMPGEEPPEDMQPMQNRGNGEESQTNMTEPIYDPVSGSVMYGHVYAAYYAEYLNDAQSGNIPTELTDAADAYFNSLNQ